MFAGSMDSKGMMCALRAASGKILWSLLSGARVYSGPAVVNGVL
jgi:hypothetical protein